jgi:hypothetical protein
MIYRPVQWRLRYNAGNVEKATDAFGVILRASISSTTRKESWVWLALARMREREWVQYKIEMEPMRRDLPRQPSKLQIH